MAPKKITAAHFSADTLEFLGLLDKYGVKYLIVGGEAVVYHGHIRLTGDVDIYYSPEAANVRQLYNALQEFWNGDIPGIESEEDLRKTGVIFQFGVPPNRIDIMNEVDDLEFEAAWNERDDFILHAGRQQLTIHYIGLRSLIRNKRKVNRPRDQEDLKFLEALIRKKSR